MFAGFLVFAAVMMLAYTPRPRERTTGIGTVAALGASVGGLAGFLGGLLGVGRGNIVVPALVALGMEPKKASATTSIIVIFSSLSGFLGHVSLAGMNAPLLAFTVAASAAGAVAGAWLMTEKLRSRQVKVTIGVVLLAIAAKMALGLLR